MAGGAWTVEDWLNGDVAGQVAVRCPFHDDSSPSATVYADGGVHCHGCKVSHTLVGLVAHLYYGDLPPGAGRSMARRHLAAGGFAERATAAPTAANRAPEPPSDLTYRTLTAMTRIATEELARRPGIVAAIAAERGLRDPLALGLGWAADDLGERLTHAMGFDAATAEEQLVAAGVAYAPRPDEHDRVRPPQTRPRLVRHRLLLPDRGDAAGRATTLFYQARATADAAVKYLGPPRIAKPLFGLASLHRPTGTVWLGEGPFDVLPLVEAGEAAVAATGSALKATLVLELVAAAAGREILVAFDADASGRRAAPVVAAMLREAGATARVIEPPAPFKDLGAWCAAEGAAEVVAEATWTGPA